MLERQATIDDSSFWTKESIGYYIGFSLKDYRQAVRLQKIIHRTSSYSACDADWKLSSAQWARSTLIAFNRFWTRMSDTLSLQNLYTGSRSIRIGNQVVVTMFNLFQSRFVWRCSLRYSCISKWIAADDYRLLVEGQSVDNRQSACYRPKNITRNCAKLANWLDLHDNPIEGAVADFAVLTGLLPGVPNSMDNCWWEFRICKIQIFFWDQ